MMACEWGDQIKSLVQPNPDDFAVLFSDTATVQLSTVLTDSSFTGAPSRLLVGRYIDPYFGKIQTASFFQPTTQTAITVPVAAEYDSLVLSLTYDNYTYGDTTKQLNLSVHKVLADILDKDAYYNTNSTAFEETPLGKVKINPTPRTTKRLIIKLSDVLGKDIFERGKTNLITSNEDWINLVKGILIKGGASDNGAVIGFRSDLVYLQLHYRIPDVDGVKKDSSVFRSSASYNQILADRSGTIVAKLPANQRVAIPSAQTGNMSFIQAGLGIMTRIDLPSVRNLRFTKYSVANRAFLRITPKQFSVTDQLKAPPQIYVFRCNKNNEFYLGGDGFPLALTNLSTQQPVAISANYTVDVINNKQYYLLDLSSYVTELLTSETGDVGGLLLRTSAFNSGSNRPSTTYPSADTEFTNGLNRLVIGDQKSSDPGVKLELYYTTVKVE
ncbi:DUF4270 family protein [Dyadobacter arcticus]|nr:DUF4270 family protein [Dyadobacter arcticus]